jgi:hypothetical protein
MSAPSAWYGLMMELWVVLSSLLWLQLPHSGLTDRAPGMLMRHMADMSWLERHDMRVW